MLDHTQFQKVFPAGVQMPYDRKLQHEIEARRKDMGGQLFIDRVMKALGITKGKLYPPKNDNGVRQLHLQICEAGMSTHHKLSLLYYILLDFDIVNGQPYVSESFVAESGIPKNYQIFMKGLWHMDREEFSDALEYISHPSLIADFADDIIITLVQRASHDYGLALSYFYAVQPILKSPKALELLFTAMVRTNVTEALLYSRTHPEHVREILFRQLIAKSLEGNHSNQADELPFLPFDRAEETWFEEYLSTGEGRNLKKGKDTLLIRKIASDQFADIRTLRASGQWGAVLEGIKAGTGSQIE
ncbi:Protein ELYS [Cladobotryum mycophilum]|uniref:Protein ELYS n=1 Tax=Cladobotryum mycophilum TaxID=491253 RepID=A0ABR0SU30_9HYPO